MIIDKLANAELRDPTSGFWYGDVGQITKSGIGVTEALAMTLSACWACTRALAGPGGYLPFNLHRRVKGGGSELADKHPVHRIIHDAPNYEMGATMWRSMGIAQQVNSGNTYAEIERTNGGELLNLWPIHPTRVSFRRDENGEMYYQVRVESGQPVDLLPEDVFHVPSMMSDDGINGKGVIRNARETIGHAIATETYGSSWFGSGGRLSAVLKHPKRMDKEARDNLRKEWKSLYGGASGDKVGILWEGMDYTPIGSDPEDSQFIASRQHNIEEICRWYGVPPHMVQHLLRATFNNIEELGLEFVRYHLLPWLKLWEQEVWRKLLTPTEQLTYFAKHNVDALERGDLTKRTAALAQQFFNGALTINEWMNLEDRNPIGPDGDVRFVQSSMVTLDAAINPPEPPAPAALALPAPEADDEPEDEESTAVEALRDSYHERLASVKRRSRNAAVKMIEAAVGRMLAKESNEAKRAAKKPDMFVFWINDFYTYDKHRGTLEAELVAPADAYMAASDDEDAARLAVYHLVDNHVSRSRSDLLSACECQPEELASRIEALVETWNNTRKEVSL